MQIGDPPPTDASRGAQNLRFRNAPLGLEFRHLTRSGVRASVFSLSSSALGAGCLTLPHAVRGAGLGVSILAFALSSTLTLMSASIVVRCSASLRAKTSPSTSPGPVPTWAPLLEAALGARSGALVDLLLAVFGFGVVVLYYSFIGDFLSSLWNSVAGGKALRWPFIVGSLVLTIPMGLPNDIGALRYASVFIVGVLVLLTVTSWVALATCSGPEVAEPVVWIESSPAGALQSFCTFIFTQMIHLNIFTVFESLSPPHSWSPRSLDPRETADADRMRNIVGFAVITGVLVNINCALPGYLLWRGSTQQDFILNYNEKACPAGIMWVIRAIEVLLALITGCGIPINLVPSRQGLVRLVRRCMPVHAPDPFESIVPRLLLTVSICTALSYIAVAAGGAVNDIINLLGGTLSTLLMFVLPALFYWNSGLDADRPKLKALNFLAFMVGASAGFGSIILTILGKFMG